MKLINNRTYWSLFLLLNLSGTALSDELGVSSVVSWDSRYFLEGRDVLEGDSIATASAEVSWEVLSAGLWYGFSPEQDYDEVQLSLSLNHSIGDFSFYAAYTHFQFPRPGGNTDEVGIGVSWSRGALEFALDSYYNFDDEGYFTELSSSRTFLLTEDLSMSLSGVIGINENYTPDGHDGLNHLALSLGLEYTPLLKGLPSPAI